MLLIRCLEEGLGPLFADQGGRGDHGGEGPLFDQESRGLDLDLIDDGGIGDRGAGADGRVHPLDGNKRIPHRGTKIDHDVGMVEEPGSRLVARFSGHALRNGSHRYHIHSPMPSPDRHLDRNGGKTAGAEDHHQVVRTEVEVGQNLLGQAMDPLDEHRLPLTIGARHLSMKGHR